MLNTTMKIETTKILNTKFGQIEIELEKIIEFKYGLIGIPEFTKFSLVPCPHEKFTNFFILQSCESDELNFLLMPVTEIKKIYAPNDIYQAMEETGFKKERTDVLLVVSMKRTAECTFLTANSKAPIFIDSINLKALQHVINTNNYELQMTL